MIDLLQYIGSGILLVHNVPQLIRAVLNYKKYGYIRDISLIKELLCCIGSLLCLLWSLTTGNFGFVVLNAVQVLYALFMIGLIMKGS